MCGIIVSGARVVMACERVLHDVASEVFFKCEERVVSGRCMRFFVHSALLAALCVALLPSASSQSFPNKPISIICPFPPGSGNDLVARILAPKITDAWHQPVIVENRPGAGGGVAAQSAARAASDGYTLFIPSSSNAINMHGGSANYNLLNDFAPVVLVGQLPFILVAPATLPVSSINELIALAKAKPHQLSFASSGIASTGHLIGELVRIRSAIDIVHVPYKGGGPASADLIAGRVHMLFTNMATMAPHVIAGRLKGLGVSGPKRAAALPEVPTMIEAGYPYLDIGTWFAILAPAATPKAIVTQLNSEFVRILAMPDVRQQLSKQGVEASGGAPEEAASFLKDDVARWGKIIKDAGIRLE